MDKILAIGGANLQGSVRISGAKNAALPIIFTSLLTDDPLTISGIPHLHDITTTMELLGYLGVDICVHEKMKIVLTANNVNTYEAPDYLVKKMRASILSLGPLVAKHGKAVLPLPGGCAIGSRPIDVHIKGLSKLGAKIEIKNGSVYAEADGRLQGAEIDLEIVSVTGTENLLMASVLAKGETVIKNAAVEPEVQDLANCLNKMGARIDGIGTSELRIVGVDRLHGTQYTIIPDRIEAGTFLVAAMVAKGDLLLKSVIPNHLTAVINKLEEAGADIETGPDWIRIKSPNHPIRPVDINTEIYPGFPTDLQAQFVLLNAVADGKSTVTENIFENRFMHVEELKRMGAKIKVSGRQLFIEGVSNLYGTSVTATDLRASACLVIAGLIAKGSTMIDQIYHIDRGYEHIEIKLSALGGNIKRVL